MSGWGVVIGIGMILFGLSILPAGVMMFFAGLAGFATQPPALAAAVIALASLMVVGGLYFLKWGAEEILDVVKEYCCYREEKALPSHQ